MKKTFLLLLFAGVLMSCLDDDYAQPNLINNGMEIYSIVSNQQDYAMDPVSTAFRLNMLLTAANELGTPGDFSNIMYVNKSDNTRIPMSEHLFSSIRSITQTGDGVWELDFAGGGFHGARTGKVVVNTAGLTLQELYGTDKGWTVKLEDSSTLLYNFSQGSDEKYLEWLNGEVVITPAIIENSWDVVISNYVCHYNKVADKHNSLWNVDFTITRDGSGPMTYDNCMKSVFTVAGKASGIPYLSDIPMTYHITNALRYKPACRPSYISTGTVVASFDRRDDLPESDYPALDVTIQWDEISADCRNTATVIYNGNSAILMY